jgi:hypothetical protein
MSLWVGVWTCRLTVRLRNKQLHDLREHIYQKLNIKLEILTQQTGRRVAKQKQDRFNLL